MSNWKTRLALSAILAATPCFATVITDNTGLSEPHTTITFSEIAFPTGTPITNEFASFGASFSPSMFYNVQPQFFPTESLANFDFTTTNDPIVIQFTGVVLGAAFAMQTNPGTSTFEALLNGVVVESFSASTTFSSLPDLSQSSNFYGFTGVAFDSIRITPTGGFFQIDNLQVSSVPEPSSLMLLGAGLAGCAARYRKSRQSV